MTFVEERIKGEDGKDSRSLRGPYLARLELMHRLRERGCPEESLLGKTHIVKTVYFALFLSLALCQRLYTLSMWLYVALNRRSFRANGAVLWEIWRQTLLYHRPKNIPTSALSWSTCSGKAELQQYSRADACEGKGRAVKHISLLNFLVHQPSEWSGSTGRAGRGGIRFSGGYQSATEAFVCVSAESSTGAASLPQCGWKTAAYRRAQSSLSSRTQVW